MKILIWVSIVLAVTALILIPVVGVTGPEGAQGPAGATGAQGPAGADGATGAQGAAGPPIAPSFTATDGDLTSNFAGSVSVAGNFSVNGALIFNTPITFADGDTTPDVASGNIFKTANNTTTLITMFDSGTAGQTITIIFTDGNTTVAGANLLLVLGGFHPAANDTLTLVFDGAKWYEISRSIFNLPPLQ